jgi:hypothetical protein
LLQNEVTDYNRENRLEFSMLSGSDRSSLSSKFDAKSYNERIK